MQRPVEPIAAGEPTRLLVAALRDLAVTRLGDRLMRLFESADDHLFELASNARNNDEQRNAFDVMRVLRSERQAMTTRFADLLGAGFVGGQPGKAVLRPQPPTAIADDLSLRESRTVEENIALSNMERKAENRYRDPLWELGRRLDWLAEARAAPLARDALMPAALCRAIQSAVVPLRVELEILLLIYKLFDRSVMGTLSPFYEEVLRLLIDRGVQPAMRPVPRGRGGGAPRKPAAAAFEPLAGFDPQTAALLRQLAGGLSPAASSYGDADLAGDLAAAVEGRPVSGWGEPQARAYAQRAGLVGRMFSELLDELELPATAQHDFDLLRFAVIKSALKDTGFFADADHPVRGLLNELATMAATAQASGPEAVERVAQLVAAVRHQFEESAAALRAPEDPVQAIDERLIERFVDEQQEQNRSRRKAIVTRVREIVAAELKLKTLGRVIPEPARPLLFSGWSVIMAYHLTHHGAESEPWREGLRQLDGILRALDPRDQTPPDRRELAVLEHDLRDTLRHVGIGDERVEAMLAGFAEATRDGQRQHLSLVVSRDDATEPVAESEHAGKAETLVLELLLIPGRWFHLHDAQQNQRRWLKFTGSRDGDAALAVFAEFNGRNTLELAREQLLDDLIAHRSEPIDAPPACRQALDTLIARRQRQA